MNKLAFQIYGTKKATPFQSIWNTTETSAVGTELAGTAATTPLPLGWAGTNLLTGGYTHTAGNTAVLLVNNLTPTAGQSYQIICTLSAGSTGSVIINWGGVSSVAISATTTITLTPINAAIKLSITPSSTFVGTVSLSIKTSSSAANQIQLPIIISSGKSVWIDWGDGQYSTMNSTNYIANRIHTYASTGEYPVRVFGDDFSFGFGSGINDRLKIKSISSWGKLKIGASSFNGCSNVTMSGITDIPDLTGVTSFQSTFYGCSAITTIGRINEWNTSTITNTGQMFYGCALFNSNISNWNVSQVTSFSQMFFTAVTFNNGYAYGVVNTLPWITTNMINVSQMFTGSVAFNSNISSWDVRNVTNFSQMFQNANSFNNGFASGVVNTLPWTINNTAASVNMSNLFAGAVSFNSNLGTGTTPWDVSKVTTFASMFSGATNFRNGDNTAPINDWNIGGSVTAVSMAGMFQSASVFNRDISNWNMTKVTNMSAMFQTAFAFNQNIGSWNVSNVTTFNNMFRQASAFNNGGSPNINNWILKTTGNIDMSQMFYLSTAFSQPLNSWNVSRVTNMGYMFANANAFNQPIDSWDVSSVINMESMFAGNTFFNQPINSWNTVSVLGMVGMFEGATAFNQPIDNWNMTNVTATRYMFNSATAFNQPLANWERVGSTLANVTSMNNMFSGFIPFNQLIGNWNVSGVTNFSNFMANKTPATFSSTNLDAIYNGWIVNGVQPNINISFGTIKYTSVGTPGKNTLLAAPNNWIIQDGGI